MYCFMTSIYVTDICDDTFSYKQVIISEVFVIMDCVKPSVTLYAWRQLERKTNVYNSLPTILLKHQADTVSTEPNIKIP